jgi:hypothetical protein
MKTPKMNLYYYLKFRNFLDSLAYKIRFNAFHYKSLLH